MNKEMEMTQNLLQFIKKSPTAFHTVKAVQDELDQVGYTELSENESWSLTGGGSYYVIRNSSSIISFRIPEEKRFHGFMIAAAHSDSPAFKLKEHPEMTGSGAYTKLNVEKYGGMLMAPWFDRPLSVAGRVIVKKDNSFETKLINIDRDLCLIPSLAIHMNHDANSGMKYNPQKDLLPVIGTEASNGRLMEIIAKEAGCEPENIVGNDLFLYSRSEGSIWGADNEFVSVGHLDDLQCVYASLEGFLNAESKKEIIPMLAVFDNEEVGSGTKQGADSTFLADTLTRICEALDITQSGYRQKLASSFMVSADNAHAIHPNAPEKADPVNQPKINQGIVIKYNANQKYTTDALSQALFREICQRADVPYQDYTNRSDMPGGSTLGNISNAHVSINTVDIGLPQLAMHSAYETAGVKDTSYLVTAMKVLFESEIICNGSGSYTFN